MEMLYAPEPGIPLPPDELAAKNRADMAQFREAKRALGG